MFKVNYHLARKCKLDKIKKEIEEYPARYGYQPPKYLLFIRDMLERGWGVSLYKGGQRGISKYVFLRKGTHFYKVRFSNHRPIYNKEVTNDCDFYVGISHTQVSTTEDIIKKLDALCTP